MSRGERGSFEKTSVDTASPSPPSTLPPPTPSSNLRSLDTLTCRRFCRLRYKPSIFPSPPLFPEDTLLKISMKISPIFFSPPNNTDIKMNFQKFPRPYSNDRRRDRMPSSRFPSSSRAPFLSSFLFFSFFHLSLFKLASTGR